MDRGSQLSQDDEDDEDDKDDKDDKEDEEEEERRTRQEEAEEEQEEEATDIKSNNPHLAGGEETVQDGRAPRFFSMGLLPHLPAISRIIPSLWHPQGAAELLRC